MLLVYAVFKLTWRQGTKQPQCKKIKVYTALTKKPANAPRFFKFFTPEQPLLL